eukprot:TRINITY_DN6176_c0_g1_i1.p1 TRINITY_DN6176_c0_g1~~TRINITY_DN6176_c0_g1_i1.p1  ORF type:complete len:310 (-),score=77.39 TRINITY_DN6176_c0_g1_i1:145-1074(-)
MALPALPTIKELINLFGLKAKQQLSQNFILDLNVTNKMVGKTTHRVGPMLRKTVIEVGPGPGPLSRSILNAGCPNLILVEKDPRFLPSLEMLKEASEKTCKVDIHQGDILEVDEAKLLASTNTQKKAWSDSSDVVILGNLPFAVSTPLVIKWMKQLHHRQGAFSYGRTPMTLTFQKEVAERIVALPGCRQYNRLSIMVQHLCEAKMLFEIGAKNFVPQPKVDAGVVYMEPKIKPDIEVDIDVLEQFCRIVFSQKRKVIGNCIKKIDDKAGVLLELGGIDPSLRPEQISVNNYCLLANLYRNSTFYNPEL